jgi:hypothetical protein
MDRRRWIAVRIAAIPVTVIGPAEFFVIAPSIAMRWRPLPLVAAFVRLGDRRTASDAMATTMARMMFRFITASFVS